MKIMQTGQDKCYDENGIQISCEGSGQDGEYRKGLAWPVPRFRRSGEIVEDLLTGLTWTANANPAIFPLTWQESFDSIRTMNHRSAHGFADWRLPDRNELRSLLSYQARRPALPGNHLFADVFPGWYWTATTAAINPEYAWYVHLDGARMFYGRKEQFAMMWPVRGMSAVLPPAGQKYCGGTGVAAQADNEEGVTEIGQRFIVEEDSVLDQETQLCWMRIASLGQQAVTWREALRMIADINSSVAETDRKWRLPNINELASLVDCGRHTPALPDNHPFAMVKDVYWSSTTSFFETDWAWALYLDKGATGVGFKKKAEFNIWPVRDKEKLLPV